VILIRPGDTYYALSVANDPQAGVWTSSSPAHVSQSKTYRNGAVAAGNPPTVTDNGSGLLSVTLAVPSGWAAGDVVQVLVAWDYAGGSGNAYTVPLPAFTLQAARVGDLNTPAEAAGRPSTLAAMLRRVFEAWSNLQTRDSSTGAVKIIGRDGVTTLQTQTLSTTGSVDQITEGA
jgi:hypothetical protein